MSQNMKKAKTNKSDKSVLKTLNSPIAACDLLKALRGQGFFEAESCDDGVLIPDGQYGAAERVLIKLESGERLEPLYDQDGEYIENPEVGKGQALLVPEYRGADLAWTAAERCLHNPVLVKDGKSKKAIAEGLRELFAAIEADVKARPEAYEGLTWADVYVRRRNGGDEDLDSLDLVSILTDRKRLAAGSARGCADAERISPDEIDDRLEREGDTVALDRDGSLLAPAAERGGVYDFPPGFVDARPGLLEISRGDGDVWFVDALDEEMPSDAQIRALSGILIGGRFDDPTEVDVYVGVPGESLKLRRFDEKGIADAFRRLLGKKGKAGKAKPAGGSGSGSGSPEKAAGKAPEGDARPPLTARETLIALSVVNNGDWDKIYDAIKRMDHLDRGEADAAIASLKALGLAATTLIDPDYPAALKECRRPPFAVFSDDGGKALRALAKEKNPCVVYLPAISYEGGLGDYGQAAELRSSGAGELELYVRSTRDKALISTRPGGIPSLREAHRLAVQLASRGGVIAVPETPYGEADLDAFLSEALRDADPGLAPEIVASVTAGRSWNTMALRNGFARVWIDQSDVKDAIRRATGQYYEPDLSWDGDGR